MSKNRDRISTEDRITSSDSLFYPPSSPNNWNIQFIFNKTHDRNTTCSYNITTGVWNREESVTVLFDEVERYTSAVCFHMSRKYVNHSAQRGSSKITRETTKQAHTGTYARQTKPNQTLCNVRPAGNPQTAQWGNRSWLTRGSDGGHRCVFLLTPNWLLVRKSPTELPIESGSILCVRGDARIQRSLLRPIRYYSIGYSCVCHFPHDPNKLSIVPAELNSYGDIQIELYRGVSKPCPLSLH